MRRHIPIRPRERAVSYDILVRHGTPCPYCGTTMRVHRYQRTAGRRPFNEPDYPTRDHVIPRSWMPGMGHVIVCRSCNIDKADRSIDQWYGDLERHSDPRAARVRAFMTDNASFRRTERPVRPVRTDDAGPGNLHLQPLQEAEKEDTHRC